MNAAQVEDWLRAYLRAYRSGEPGEIRALFSAGVEYRPEPYKRSFRGRESVVGYWLGEPVGPGFEARARLLAFDPVVKVAVMEWRAFYPEAPTGDDESRCVLVAKFDRHGRCVRLEEWG